jgi:hypothetical protein
VWTGGITLLAPSRMRDTNATAEAITGENSPTRQRMRYVSGVNIGLGGVGGRLLMKPSNRKKSKHTDRPTLPELDQTKRSVLNSLASLQSRRSYQHAMEEFIDCGVRRS